MNTYNPFEELENRLERIERLLQSLNFTKGKEGTEDALMTIDEAAKYLRRPKKTLYLYTSQRQIPFIKNGRSLQFRKTELDKWLKTKSYEI